MEIAIIFCVVGVVISLFLSESNKRNIEIFRLAYNELAEEHNKLTEDHNELVDSHNALVADLDEEVDSSNKNFQIVNRALLPLLECKELELRTLMEIHSDDDATH